MIKIPTFHSSFTLSLLAVITLNGCALVQRPYVPPSSGDKANFRALSSSGLPFTGPIALFTDAKACRGRYFFHTQPGQTPITTIPAGAPFSIAFHQPLGGSMSTGYNYCVPIITFIPQSGRNYTAIVEIVKDGCNMSLEVADSFTDQHGTPEPFTYKEFSNGFDEDSSFCNSKD